MPLVCHKGVLFQAWALLKLLYPDIYDEYVTVSESRRFSIKAKAVDEAA